MMDTTLMAVDGALQHHQAFVAPMSSRFDGVSPSGNCALPTLDIAATDPDSDPVTIHYTLDGSTPIKIVQFG